MKNVFLIAFIFLMEWIIFDYFGQGTADAMPGFSRKYDAACSSCHVAFPKLNEYGIEFRQRGFREEKEGPGRPVWKLPGIPLGGMVEGAYTFENLDAQTPKQSSEVNVENVQFMAGGVLGPGISFFGDVLGNLDGKTDIVPKHFFMIFNDILSESRLNIKVGAYHIDFPFLSDHRIPTRTHYLARVTATGSEEVGPGSRGAEINGYLNESKLRYALGIRKAAVINSTNRMQSFYGWVTKSVELMGFEQTVGTIFLQDKNGDKVAGTDQTTQSVGGVLDLHYGLTGLVAGFFHYDGGIVDVPRVINSGLIEILHSFTLTQKDLIGVARFDFQKGAGSPMQAFQGVGNLQYYFLPNVKGQAEFSYRTNKSLAGIKTDEKIGTLALTFAF